MLTMFAYIVFVLALSSGSVYACARFGRKFEELLPITCIGIVLILFVFGIMGILEIGVLAVMLAVIVLYLQSAAILIKRKKMTDFLSALITPGSIIFLCTCVALALLNRGRLAYGWDEFSHWVDIVKAMTTLDDFGTNIASQSAFQSYPPGMSLFQYFLQKLVLFLIPI